MDYPNFSPKTFKNQTVFIFLMDEENLLVKERLKKLEELRQLKINPYPYHFDKTHHANDLSHKYANLKPEEHTKDHVSIAGRIMTLRRMGKVTFLHIADGHGKIQCYFREDETKEYSHLKLLDMGDFIGVQGHIFKTKTGEITIAVTEFLILSKAIRPLPEKFHGLKDPELRYRMRYLDLIMNPDVKETFIKRYHIIKEIRNFLDDKGFIEVETPALQPIYGGAAARPFTTHHNALNMKLYMRISPEMYLKRLIIGGYEKVYEICKNFRNEGVDYTHNPEFTMLEFYQAYADYNDMMDMAEEMIKKIAKKVNGTLTVEYRGNKIDLSKKWTRMTMKEALKKYADLDVDKYTDQELFDLVRTYNLEYHGDLTRGGVMTVLFEELVEEELIQPHFIMDYPVEVSPLTKIHRKDSQFTERFELFINGQEWANAYSELTDPLDQRKRLEAQEKLRVIGEEAQPMDEDFIRAMEYGMPPTGGLGLGVDRLIALLCGKDTIRDIIFFPTMKPEAGVKEQPIVTRTSGMPGELR